MFPVSAVGLKVRRTLPTLAGLCLAAILMYALFWAGLKDPLGPLPKFGQRRTFPDFTLLSLDGRHWTLSAQRGNVVLVNVFGTTCGPCRLEIPELVGITGRYERQGFRVVGISIDEDPLQTVPAFVDHFHIPYPVLACYPPESDKIANDEKPRARCKIEDSIETIAASHLGSSTEGVPITVLIDRSGRLARVYYGYYGAYQDRLLDRDIRQLLKER